jgi:hypothetical protein
MAKVLNIKDCNYKVPAGAVYVGRAMSRYNLLASKWGNPFKIGRDGTREEVIQKYSEYIVPRILDGELDIKELEGKDLVCWCAPLPCHGDVLLELAKRKEEK